MPLNLDAGIDLIKRFEGLHKVVRIHDREMIAAYRCPAGILTIAWGHVVGRGEPTLITEDDADDLLAEDAQKAAAGVLKFATYPITPNQAGALTSFTFNVGLGAFRQSTLLRKLNRGDILGASEEFARWRYAGGRILAGLVLRREAERALFLS